MACLVQYWGMYGLRFLKSPLWRKKLIRPTPELHVELFVAM